MLVLEESGRVSGTYKAVLIVLMYIGVSRGSEEIRDFFVVDMKLYFQFFYVGVFSSCVRIYMCVH